MFFTTVEIKLLRAIVALHNMTGSVPASEHIEQKLTHLIEEFIVEVPEEQDHIQS